MSEPFIVGTVRALASPAIATIGGGAWAVGWAHNDEPNVSQRFNVLSSEGLSRPADQEVLEGQMNTTHPPRMATTEFGIAYAAPYFDGSTERLQLALINPASPAAPPASTLIRAAASITVGGVAVAPGNSKQNTVIGVASRSRAAKGEHDIAFFDANLARLDGGIDAPTSSGSAVDIAWSRDVSRFGVAYIDDSKAQGFLTRYDGSSPFGASTATLFTDDAHKAVGGLVAVAATAEHFVVAWQADTNPDQLTLRRIDADTGSPLEMADVGNTFAPNAIALLYDGKSFVLAWATYNTRKLRMRRFDAATLTPLGDIISLLPDGMELYDNDFDLAHSGVNSYAVAIAQGPFGEISAPVVLTVTCDGP